MPLENRHGAFPLSHLTEQRAVVRFFTLKSLSLKDIHIELEPVQTDEALCLSTVSQWRGGFMHGERSYLVIRDLDDLSRMMSLKSFVL
jgi:hypothetical protein